jgi:hypothetical protein
MLRRHLERKKPCKPPQNESSEENMPTQQKNMPKYAKICQDSTKKYAKICQNMPMGANINKIRSKTGDELFICKFCKKEFTLYTSVKRHQNELRCDKMKAKDMNQIILKKKNKKIEKIKNDSTTLALIKNSSSSQIQNGDNNSSNNSSIINNNGTMNNANTINNVNSNNTINNTINNNIEIKINPIGKEDTSFLTKEDKLRILNRIYNSIPELVKTIHNHPSNRNFYLPNTNKNVIACLNNQNEIEYNDYNDVCQQILQDNVERLDELFTELETEVNDSIRNRLERVIQKVEDGKLDKKYVKDIKLYILNNSKRNKNEIIEYIEQIENNPETNLDSDSNK